MNEKIEHAVDAIFSGYEDTAELRDFKKEIGVNLAERIADMTRAGVSAEEALSKALDELGDITEAADAVSRRKRQEIIGRAYTGTFHLDRLHAIGYPVLGLVFLFGFISGAITWFATGMETAALGALMPFIVTAVCGFVFLGLTQETKTHYPVSKKRSLFYALAVLLVLSGIFISGLTFFAVKNDSGAIQRTAAEPHFISENIGLVSMLSVLIPFCLPGAALLAFLVLSEKDRKKPWLKRIMETQSEVYDEKFGLLSGALWIAAMGFFILVGIAAGWHISWIVFLFAVAVQCILNYLILKKKT
jgi:hypothetical protein